MEEVRSIDLTAERGILAGSKAADCFGKEVVDNVAAGEIGEEVKIAAGSVAGTGEDCTDWCSVGEIGRCLGFGLGLGLGSP